MITEQAKKYILGIVHRMLIRKEGHIDDSFCKVVGELLGGEVRRKLVIALVKDLVALENDEETRYQIFTQKKNKDEMKRIMRSVNWPLLALDDDEEVSELGELVRKAYFEKDPERTKISEKSRYEISAKQFGEFFSNIDGLSLYNAFEIRSIFLKDIDKLVKNNAFSNAKHSDSFLKLCEVFELTTIQSDLLYIYYLYETLDEFSDFIQYGRFDFSERKKAVGALSKITSHSFTKIKKELRKNSRLVTAMLLSSQRHGVAIKDHISDFLQCNDSGADLFGFFFEREDTEKALDINKHRVPAVDIYSIKQILKSSKGSNILLYGAPGTGKTEFTKSLGGDLGLSVYKIKTFDSDNDDMLAEKRSALMAAKKVMPDNSILVVDEAEEILSSGSSIFYKDTSDNKAWLNTFLEGHSVNIIWITNDMTMHSSSKRRFAYATEFDSFNRAQRVDALKNIQAQQDLSIFNDEELHQIAKDYKLDPGAMSLPFSMASSLADNRVNKKKIVDNLLKSQVKLIHGKEVSEKPIETFYNPDFVNTSIPIEEITNTVAKFYEGKHPVRNICVLFQGLPGTGKTEYAKYISDHLDRNMNVKRASDILTPMWGGTEKNISEMFKESERDGDILFLDECDSLFKNRENAEKSWMVSETNELLTQMERFKGVLICATNFVENLDRAAMRRFHLKIKFEDLKKEAMQDVYKSFFGQIVRGKLNEEQVKELLSIDGLNPGDFKAVYNSIIFQSGISHNEVLERLREELSYKSKRSSISLL